MTICRSSWLATLTAGAFLVPATVGAQRDVASDSAANVHVVRTGDTLWELAARYLQDPFRWPVLHELNRDLIANPHRIYPTQQLRLPGIAPADATNAPVPTFAAPELPATGGSVPREPAGPLSFTMAAPRPLQPQSRESMESERERAQAQGLRDRLVADYVTAPYLEHGGGPARAGRLIASTAGVRTGDVAERPVVLGEEVRLVPPQGMAASVGDRYVSYRLGPELPGRGRVVQPTGVVEVTGIAGNLVQARVRQVMGPMLNGQGLLPFPQVGPAVGGSVSGTPTSIVWVDNRALLPSLHDWVILALPSGGALAEGDEVRFVRPYSATEHPATAGEEIIGTARVVRVTPYAASAIITEVRRPVIGVGLGGRVVDVRR